MADGSIIIDTKMDQKGFNIGVSKMVSRFKASMSALGGILKSVLLAGLAIFALSMNQILRGLGDSLKELIGLKGGTLQKNVGEMQGAFTELRASIAAAFLPLVEFAVPYIKQFVDWLIKAVNYASMVAASFFGLKEVTQIVPGSAAKLAKSTKDTAKAAKEALAAFDQINVLQTDTAKAQQEDKPSVELQTVPITDDILKKTEAFKKIIDALFTDPVPMLQKIWSFFADWFKASVIDPIAKWWSATWLGENFSGFIKLIQDEWAKLTAAFQDGGLMGAIQEGFRALFDAMIKIVIGFVALFDVEFAQKLAAIANNPLEFIRTKFVEVFTGIQNFALATVNNILGFITNLVNGILGAIAQISGLGTAGASAAVNLGSVGGTGGRVPHLATGGIVPAGANMLAMVGERESEAVIPLSKLNEYLNGGGGGGDITVTMPVYLDNELIYKGQQRVSRRHGTSLIASGNV